MRHLFLTILLLTEVSLSFGQGEVWLRPNKGQWHDNIMYRVKIPSGYMYLEEQGFTYLFVNLDEYWHEHENGEAETNGHKHAANPHSEDKSDFVWKFHVVKTKFLNANKPDSIVESDKAPFYENYFLGKNRERWVSNLHPVKKTKYFGLYPKIDMDFYGLENSLKYNFYIAPGGNPYDIKIRYDGQESIRVNSKGVLQVKTRFGTIEELTPVAHQIINGKKKSVPVAFNLDNAVVSFSFPSGFNPAYELVIDPELAFSTFTGATSDNWGFTACPDNFENTIGGGIVFGPGYPTTTGAHDQAYNGGQVDPDVAFPIPGFDIGITKFNKQGSALIYSTFLGGSKNEAPHSIVVNNQNQLMVYGATSSSTDFPVTAGAYQTTFGGGSEATVSGLYYSASDIFVAKLSPAGSLLAATYVGGAGNDGLNALVPTRYNYGDESRGEVMVDDAGNCYVASCTKSFNFPTANANISTHAGTQSGVVFKLNSNLSNMLWGTYIRGASGSTAAFGLQLSSTNEIFVTGTTSSNTFSTTGGAFLSSYQGGNTDGWIQKYNPVGFNLLASTYIGTSQTDLSYFIQLDPDDFVYIFGQSEGSYPITGGKYNNPGGGQFIHKFTNDLTGSVFSTRIGGTNGGPQISPTAFLVSDCYNIYITGWGGNVNISSGGVPTSNTFNFPTTPDAFQSNTNGSNFYIALYSRDMETLKFASYIGGVASSSNHVDGGTSRFDKKGTIYHAVCGSCGPSNNGFTSTPGAFSETSNSSNCNMAVFKFDLSFIEALISLPETFVCFPNPANFINNSENVNSYEWDFGDGNTSTEEEPSHTYAAPGVYEVTLIVDDTTECFIPDTARIEVIVSQFIGDAVGPAEPVCPGETVQLFAEGGELSSYRWFPTEHLSDSLSPEPFAVIWEDITYMVVIKDSCGTDTFYVDVEIHQDFPEPLPDTAICIGDDLDIIAIGGTSYSWTSDDPSFTPSDNAQITVSPDNNAHYYLELETLSGCTFRDTVLVEVDTDLPVSSLPDDLLQCLNQTTTLTPGEARRYIWSPDYNILYTDTDTNYNEVSPLIDTTYHVELINACGSTFDSVFIEVVIPDVSASPDTIICPGTEAYLSAYGGVSYLWFPSNTLNSSTQQNVIAKPEEPTMYYIEITDENGCKDTAQVFVDLHPQPVIGVVTPVYAVELEPVILQAWGSGVITWSPPEYISCTVCNNPSVFPDRTYTYTATVTDTNGCQSSRDVEVIYEGIIYVPNTFTPNGDDFNDIFSAEVLNIKEFQMMIFNRWGELIFETNDMNVGWDGTYRGKIMQDGTYVWKINYVDVTNKKGELIGHVNLLR